MLGFIGNSIMAILNTPRGDKAEETIVDTHIVMYRFAEGNQNAQQSPIMQTIVNNADELRPLESN